MIIGIYSNKISRSGSIHLKSPQSQQLSNKQLQRFPPHSSPRRAYKRPVLKPKAAPDPVSQTLAALKEHVMLMGWEVVDGLMRGWWCWFIHYIMILYDGVMLSVVFLSFSGSLSSRHALSFLPIGPLHPIWCPTKACRLAFSHLNTSISSTWFNIRSTPHRRQIAMSQTCFYHFASTASEAFVLFHHPNNPCVMFLFLLRC